MERSFIDPKTRDWYSVSVDTVRAWGMVLGLAAVLVVGFFGYRHWERQELERRASDVISECRLLVSRLQGDDVLEEFRNEFRSAVETLSTASTALGRGELERALELGGRSREILLSIFEATGSRRDGVGRAQFISVQGRVEYRRGEGGSWEDARARVVLYTGDHVKTASNGSAEILFRDGTLYTARPDTQLIVSRSHTAAGTPGEQAIRMDYGWVNLNTPARQSGKVSTPDAEARVSGESEATVTYDAGSRTGWFATYRGEMEVAAAGGQARRLEALERLEQEEGRLAEPEPLPGPPPLSAPEDNVEIDLDRMEELELVWEPIPGAAGYALQVSRNHLFVDNVIEVEDRQRPRATLGLRGQGVFQWRVAARGPGGDLGPWSTPRKFRVSAVRRAEAGGDDRPPELELEQVRAYGSIFIVGGRAEPGSFVEVNGEPVQVAADGSFTKTIQVTKEGWSFLEVRARDAGGNETVVNPRVFVESL